MLQLLSKRALLCGCFCGHPDLLFIMFWVSFHPNQFCLDLRKVFWISFLFWKELWKVLLEGVLDSYVVHSSDLEVCFSLVRGEEIFAFVNGRHSVFKIRA